MDVDGVDVGVTLRGYAVYPVPAFTKTTGLITNPHRILGSRNRGNKQLCLIPTGLPPPVVYASGLHRIHRSARYAVFSDVDFVLQILRVGADRRVRPHKMALSIPILADVRFCTGCKISA